MNDTALIADQTRRIAILEVQAADYEQRLRSIRMELIGVGGPLNDNVLQYSREQLGPLYRIKAYCDGQ